MVFELESNKSSLKTNDPLTRGTDSPGVKTNVHT